MIALSFLSFLSFFTVQELTSLAGMCYNEKRRKVRGKIMEIKSDLGLAGDHARALVQASNQLRAVEVALLDERTSLAGNIRARQAVALAQTKADEIAEASQLVAAKIQAIAQAFAEVDQLSAERIEEEGLL